MFWLAVLIALMLSGAMALAWRIALTTGQSGRIDAIWAFATGLAAVVAAAASAGDPLRRTAVCVMVAIWSLRLGLYLWRRAISGADDPRYAALKQSWGETASRRLFFFLQIQALASWPLVLTTYCAAGAPRPGLDGRDGFASPFSPSLSPAKRSPTSKWPGSSGRRPIAAGFAIKAYGRGRAIRITSSSGWAGSPIRSWRSRQGIRLDGSRSPGRWSSIGYWFTFRACRRSKRI
jgi:hypothetical protein